MLKLYKSTKIGLAPSLLFIAMLGMFSPDFNAVILNLGAFFILFCYFYKLKLNRNDCLLFIIFAISITISSWTYFRHGSIYRGGMIVMNTTAVFIIAFLIAVRQNISRINEKQNKVFYDIAYYLFFSLCFKELFLQVTRTTLRGITARGYSLYFGHLHGVDYSVIVILLIILGVKTTHYYTTIVFTILNIIFVPYRTFGFFVLFMVGIYKFYPIVQKMKRSKAFNSYLKIMIWLLVLMFLFILFWIYVIATSYEMASQKTALILEASNAGRFASMLYGIRVIIAKSLYFYGLHDVSDTMYATFADSNFVKNGLFNPHNSYILMTVQYSVFVVFLYITILSKIFDKLSSRLNDAIIISYMLTACILHNMILGGRMFMLLSILLCPSYTGNKIKHLK